MMHFQPNLKVWLHPRNARIIIQARKEVYDIVKNLGKGLFDDVASRVKNITGNLCRCEIKLFVQKYFFEVMLQKLMRIFRMVCSFYVNQIFLNI